MRFAIVLLCLTICPFLEGQQSAFVENPSFEGTPGWSQSPDGWIPCNTNSTPDTQPGFLAVKTAPSEGNSYVGLLMRNTSRFPDYVKNEAIVSKLLKPIEKSKCYILRIDIARTNALEVIDNYSIYYSIPSRLRIWGGNNICDKVEVLGLSEPVTSTEWNRIEFLIAPKENSYTYLTLENWIDPLVNSYIILDNLEFIEHESKTVRIVADTTLRGDQSMVLQVSPSSTYQWIPANGLSCTDCPNPTLNTTHSETYVCTLTDSLGCVVKEIFSIHVNVFIPNVITPNADGHNDFFRIDGLTADTELKIFDRLGKLVYENSHYDNDWQGADTHGNTLMAGTYWYALKIGGDATLYKGFIYVKY